MTAAHKRATSAAAEDNIRKDTCRLRQAVYARIKRAGAKGLTDEEGQAALAMDGNTYRPRRGELAEKGWIRSTGTRPTRAGRDAMVWVAT